MFTTVIECIFSVINNNDPLWPIDPYFSKERMYDKYIIISMEDRTCTEARTADTLDDPRRANDSFWNFSRALALNEAIHIQDNEPRTIAWEDFSEINAEGERIDKAWLDQFMLKMNGAVPTKNGLTATSGLGTYRNALKSLRNKHTGPELALRTERVRTEKLLERDFLKLAKLGKEIHPFGYGLLVSR